MTALRVGFLGDSYRKRSFTRRYQHFFRNPKLAGGLKACLIADTKSSRSTVSERQGQRKRYSNPARSSIHSNYRPRPRAVQCERGSGNSSNPFVKSHRSPSSFTPCNIFLGISIPKNEQKDHFSCQFFKISNSQSDGCGGVT